MVTNRQALLKVFYPIIKWFGRRSAKGQIIYNTKNHRPLHDFYALTATKSDGTVFDFETLKGKKVVIVNTASDCGYTQQYEALQAMYEQYQSQLVIIAFPANDFKEQEKGSDHAIAQFCKINYGVTFPIMQKSVVVPNDDQHPVFRWLTTPSLNGWCEHQPDWNFSKYIINAEGILTHYFGPAIAPDEGVFVDAILG